jgi:putative SOS response-associated peptidase YedK
MPVILPQSAWAAWLDPENHDLDALTGLLLPAPDTLLELHPVSTEVNNVRNKGPELVQPVDPAAAAGDDADADAAPPDVD